MRREGWQNSERVIHEHFDPLACHRESVGSGFCRELLVSPSELCPGLVGLGRSLLLRKECLPVVFEKSGRLGETTLALLAVKPRIAKSADQYPPGFPPGEFVEQSENPRWRRMERREPLLRLEALHAAIPQEGTGMACALTYPFGSPVCQCLRARTADGVSTFVAREIDREKKQTKCGLNRERERAFKIV